MTEETKQHILWKERMEESLRDLGLKYSQLSSEQIEYLKLRAKTEFGLIDDIVDTKDRLALIKCLFYHIENRNVWQESYHKVKERLKVATEALEFYADKSNLDDDPFSPTFWDDGNIDMGNKAREALEKIKKTNG